ncbi:GTP cyclohydrolase II [Zoogloea sp. LCSB751]|uniref:GTP cyclohydrolase II n=1 Tax=Zoogloea sp. LCSB751 TaxID=1965277 RepID=UPI0009A4B33A|nr:GTP cyclohydrolase II [Zoogloea sp. LCSB751]
MSASPAPPRHSNWLASTSLPTAYGPFAMHVFRSTVPDPEQGFREHVALVHGQVDGVAGLPVRVHSECLTGEVFGSLKCDCRDQLDLALSEIVRLGAGIVLYLRQEGRGIGLANKVRAYHLQSRGYDTVDANRMLGLPDDARSYDVVPEMLGYFKVPSIRLMTNNPDKLTKLTALGVQIDGCLPVITRPNTHSIGYIKTKRQRMGHALPDEREWAAPDALKAR